MIMKSALFHPASVAFATMAVLVGVSTARAQLAYGVDGTGTLFSFNLSSPGTINTIGNLGIVPEAIDFRPGTSTLYAVNVDSTTGNGSLFTVNTSTGAVTAVGLGFFATELNGATSIAFDFNPTTLQGDGSIRIRLVGSNGANIRLNSDTGNDVTPADGAINGVASAVVTGAAYTNSDVAVIPGGGTTALYYIDSAGDDLLLSSNPNAGTVGLVGTGLGVTVGTDIGFDIYSGGSTDIGYVTDTTGANAADLYSVDLGTGVATLVGGVARSFTGGFAIDQATSAIPEPSTYAALIGALGLGLAVTRRRRQAV